MFLSAAHVPWSSAIQSCCKSRVASACHSTFLLPAPVGVAESVPPTSGPGQRSRPLPAPHLLHSLGQSCGPHMLTLSTSHILDSPALLAAWPPEGPSAHTRFWLRASAAPKPFPRMKVSAVSATVGHRLQLPSQTPASARAFHRREESSWPVGFNEEHCPGRAGAPGWGEAGGRRRRSLGP